MKVILKTALVLAALITLSCTSKTELTTQDWVTVAKKADTPEAHEQLAKHYDEVAKTMLADADEERRLLAEYQQRPHRYGKRILDLRSRSTALIRDLEASADDSRQMADMHRQIASELR